MMESADEPPWVGDHLLLGLVEEFGVASTGLTGDHFVPDGTAPTVGGVLLVDNSAV